MGEPLNPSLYRRLVAAFGEVRIANDRQQFRCRVVRNPIHPNRTKTQGDPGEEYRVNCPHCGDTRGRLWINHQYGSMLQGVRLTNLYVCHNEHCEEDPEFREWLETRLSPMLSRGDMSVAQSLEAVEEDRDPTPVSLPTSHHVHMLPMDHPGRAYLVARGFDVELLGTQMDVRWCEYSPQMPPHHHLMFPIYAKDSAGVARCYGWQSRFLDFMNWRDAPDKTKNEIKWHTFCPKVKKFLYNGYRCEGSPVVLIGEGPLEPAVCGVNMSVACFGKTVTRNQRDYLWRSWGRQGAVGVLAFDSDAWDTTKPENRRSVQKLDRINEEMNQSWSAWVRLMLPPGKDPVDLGYKVVWEMVLNDLTRQNKRDAFFKVAHAVGAVVQ